MAYRHQRSRGEEKWRRNESEKENGHQSENRNGICQQQRRSIIGDNSENEK